MFKLRVKRWSGYPMESEHGSDRASFSTSMLSLCDPMDCSPSGSSVPGILQARILEWVAIPSSRGALLLWPQGKLDCNALPWTWWMLPVSGNNWTMPAPKASSTTVGHGAVPETGEKWTADWVWCHGREAQLCRKKGEIVLDPLQSPPLFPKPKALHALTHQWLLYPFNLSSYPLGICWFNSM